MWRYSFFFYNVQIAMHYSLTTVEMLMAAKVQFI